MKNARRDWPKGRREPGEPLEGPHAGADLQRPSTRTRVSFEVGMRQLGGETLVLVVERHAAGPRRNHRRHGAGAVALLSMPS